MAAGVEGTVREFGMDMYTLWSLKWITSKDLLRAQGTLLSFMGQPGGEGQGGENGSTFMYG